MKGILDEFAYSTSINGTLRGASGCIHQFDFVCRKNGRRLVISALEVGECESEMIEMVKLRLKTCDSAPDTVLVIIQALASSNLRSLCNCYGYLLIEKILEETVYDQLAEVLRLLQEPHE